MPLEAGLRPIGARDDLRALRGRFAILFLRALLAWSEAAGWRCGVGPAAAAPQAHGQRRRGGDAERDPPRRRRKRRRIRPSLSDEKFSLFTQFLRCLQIAFAPSKHATFSTLAPAHRRASNFFSCVLLNFFSSSDSAFLPATAANRAIEQSVLFFADTALAPYNQRHRKQRLTRNAPSSWP